MQGLAEVEGNAMRTREAQQRLQRDIGPLAKEVQRALSEVQGRDELFYQAPDIEQGSSMDSLIQSSDDLLRESQNILAETEHIGTTTLQQMGRQREQLHNMNVHLEAVQAVAVQAKNILKSMAIKACKSKLALYVMILALAWANFYVLYRIFEKNHASSSKNPDNRLLFL
jgi:vesicle transport through interaction with t-SNAREs protein 1